MTFKNPFSNWVLGKGIFFSYYLRIYTFLGYTPEDLKGRSAYELHHAQDNETVLKNYKAS
jgi:hypothetical protein